MTEPSLMTSQQAVMTEGLHPSAVLTSHQEESLQNLAVPRTSANTTETELLHILLAHFPFSDSEQ
jgi:hypothetical protein